MLRLWTGDAAIEALWNRNSSACNAHAFAHDPSVTAQERSGQVCHCAFKPMAQLDSARLHGRSQMDNTTDMVRGYAEESDGCMQLTVHERCMDATWKAQ